MYFIYDWNHAELGRSNDRHIACQMAVITVSEFFVELAFVVEESDHEDKQLVAAIVKEGEDVSMFSPTESVCPDCIDKIMGAKKYTKLTQEINSALN